MLLGICLLILLTTGLSTPLCTENEILLRNRTCYCPFFQFNGRCMRKRFQTTVNATLNQVMSAASRHLLADSPMILTIDATNYEAMQTLAASLSPLMVGGGTVVTTVADAMDTLVGGEPSTSM